MSKKKIENKKGFTLVELLAVIVIIAVIAGIATYTIGQTINKSKEKGKDISLDSIYKSAKLYLSEKNYSDYYWVINEGGNDTICIYIPELVNLGYLKQKDIKNIEYKYIQISRDNYNKTIVGEKALYENNDTCSSSYGNGSNDRETTINRNYITTSSISIQAGCEPNKGIVNYVFTLKDNNDKLLKTIEQENHVAIFKNLTRLDGDKKYKIEAKCNYSDRETSTPKSILLNVGKSDIDFKVEKVVANSTEYYKVYSINYTTDNIKNSSDKDNSVKYFKVKGLASLVGNSVKIYDCGDNNSPSTCNSSNTTTIVNNHWYKTDSNTVNLKIESNPTIYALVWDGERYSSNESTQITFQSNPRVVWSIEYNGLKKMSGGAVDRNISIDGEDTTKTVVDYYGDTNVKWLGNPTIKWRVYGTDDIESNLYYADQNYNNRGNYKTNNKLNVSLKDKEYSIKSFSIYGRQQLGIVVKNKKTNKNTIIPININFDREKPTAEITSTSTLKSASQTATLKCSDSKSGISSYYYGTSAPTSNSTYSKWSKNETKTISSDGTYYLSCKDAAGNEKTTSITYYKYNVINMLQNVTGSGYTTNNYTQSSTNSYIAPSGTNLTLSSIYTIPDGSSANKFIGISAGKPSTTAATVNKTVPTLTKNTNYTLWFNRNIVYFKFKTNEGTLTKKTTASDGTVYNWSTNSSGYITRTLNGKTIESLASYRYGTNNVDLPNYNNSAYLEIIKSNQAAKSGAEWICESGCTTANKTFSDSEIKNYNTDNICNAKNEDCTVVVKVNWTEKPVKIYYNTKGGTINGSGFTHYVSNGSKTNWVGTSASEYLVQTFNGDTVNNLYYVNGSINITRSGYSPKSGAEWCARDKNNSYDNCFDQAVKYKYNQLKKYYKEEKSEYYEVWLYANWKDINPPTAPIITNPTNGNWVKDPFSLTVSSTDSESGISYYQYTYSATATETGTNHDTQWKTYADSAKTSFITTKFSAQRNQLVYIRACDNEDNCSSKSSTYIRIDTTAPNGPTTNTIDKNGNLIISGGSDAQSGLRSYYNLSINDKNYSLTGNTYNLKDYTTNGDYYVYTSIHDIAGNKSDVLEKKLTVSSKLHHYKCPSGYYWNSDYTQCYYTTNVSCSSSTSWNIICSASEYFSGCTTYTSYSYTKNSCHNNCGGWYDDHCVFYRCPSTSSSCSCPSGTRYGDYCYHYTSYYNDYDYCPSDTTEYNGKCYKLS